MGGDQQGARRTADPGRADGAGRPRRHRKAKANGSWEVYDSVERLEVPADLADALEARPGATRELRGFPAVGAQDAARLDRARTTAGDARGTHRDGRRCGRPERACSKLAAGRERSRVRAVGGSLSLVVVLVVVATIRLLDQPLALQSYRMVEPRRSRSSGTAHRTPGRVSPVSQRRRRRSRSA